MTRTLIFLLVSVSAFAATDPIDPLRLPYGGTWQNIVGVSNGIPHRTTIYTTFTATATSGMINAALAACPSNQVVFCSNGDYTIGTPGIHHFKSGVTLRGGTNANGTPATQFSFSTTDQQSFLTIGNSTGGWDVSDNTKWTAKTISSGATRGSTTVTLSASPTGLSAGMIAVFTAPSGGNVTGSGFSDFFGTHPAAQWVRVTAISGNDVSFYPPFNADYWSSTRLIYRGAGDQIDLAGVENIKLVRSAGVDSYIGIWGGAECWLENVETFSVPSGAQHSYIYCTFRFEIRHCNFHHATTFGSSTYCIQGIQSSSMLVINNRFHDMANVFPMFGISCSAFAYNFCTNMPYVDTQNGWLSQIVYFHGSHNSYNLIEGNWLPASYSDATPGSRNNLFFRNRIKGWDGSDGGKTQNTQCITTESHHDNIVAAYNVMGEDGYHTSYNAGGALSILDLDATSATTFSATNNYDTVGDAIRYPVTGGQAAPNSYLFSSQPNWLPNYPPIDPSNYSRSNEPTNLPAGYNYVNGSDPADYSPAVATLLSVGGARLRLPR